MPKIGIFWFYRGTVLGRAVDLAAGEQGVPGLLDSPDNHAALWENDRKLLALFPELRGQEYFAVPRGRVLWKTAEQEAVIYLDAKLLNKEVQQKILDFFDLGEAKIVWRTDPHYSTGL